MRVIKLLCSYLCFQKLYIYAKNEKDKREAKQLDLAKMNPSFHHVFIEWLHEVAKSMSKGESGQLTSQHTFTEHQ